MPLQRLRPSQRTGLRDPRGDRGRCAGPGAVSNYLKLRDEIAGAADRLATRLAQKSDARVQNKALRKRLDDKYPRR